MVGLNTEGNIIDAQSTPPNSMLDCSNISFFRPGRCIARKGHPEINPSLLSPSLKSNIFLSVLESGDQNWFAAYKHGYDSGGDIWNFNAGTATTIDTNKVKTYLYSSVNATPGTPTYGQRATDGPTAAVSPVFTDSLSLTPSFTETAHNTYMLACNGLYEYRNAVDSVGFYRLPFPIAAIDTTTLNVPGKFSEWVDTSAPTTSKWLLTGYAVKITAIIKYYINDTQFIESPLSNEVEVKNLLGFAAVKIKNPYFTAQLANIQDTNNCYLEVYRTIQYPISTDPNNPTVPPSEKRLCYTESLAAIAADGSPVWTQDGTNKNKFVRRLDLSLTYNDDFISGRQLIYTDINAEGAVYEHMVPPVARDIVTTKQVTIYGGVVLPPHGTITLTNNPASNQTIQVDSSAIVGTVLAQSNASSLGSGASTKYSLEYSGSYYGQQTGQQVFIHPSFTADTNDNTFCVPAYAQVTVNNGLTLVGVPAADGTRTVRITPKTDITPFDVSQFTAPGVLAVVRSYTKGTNPGLVIDLLFFRDLESVQGSNTVDLFECFSVSGFTSQIYGTTPGSTDNQAPFLYYIPGTIAIGQSTPTNTALADLPVYFSGSGPLYNGGVPYSNYDTNPFLSLLPTYKKYPTEKWFDTPGGVATSFTYDSVTTHGLTASIQFIGVTNRPQTTLVNDAAKSLSTSINTQNNYTYYSELTGNIGEILLWNTQPGYPLGVLSNTITVNADSGLTFAEPIGVASNYNIVQEVVYKNGIVVAKCNRPGAISLANGTSPTRVGSDNNWIQRVIVDNDIIYVFKEEEGIYRITLTTDSINPTVESVVQISNCVWAVSPSTIFKSGNVITFLSNRGVEQIYNGATNLISGAMAGTVNETSAGITTTLLNEIELQRSQTTGVYANKTDAQKLSYIRGFNNEHKDQWGVYFPVSGNTYVFEMGTKNWEKWTIPFDAVAVRASGQLTTIFYNSASGWNEVRQDRYSTGAVMDPTDQYDESWILTGATITNTAGAVSIQRSGGATVQTDLNNFILRLGSRTLWLKDGSGNLYQMSNVTTAAHTINAKFADGSSHTVTTAWSLVLGVPVSVTANRFFSSGPVTLTRFSECHLQCPGLHTNVRVGFEADNSSPDFSTVTYTTIPAEYDSMRVIVPINEKRARWIMPNILHDTPNEVFNLSGIGWVVRDLETWRTRR